MTPGNKDELLFDELVWVEKAREEHETFSATISGSGAQVLYLATLLEEVLTDRELAVEFVDAHVTDDLCGRRLAERVRRFLIELPVPGLVRHLIGGVTLEEVGEAEGLFAALHGPDDFILTPLPNAVFMRDSSVWVGDGVILNPMNRPVRQRETDLLRLIYGLHPRFAGTPIWFGDQPGEHYPASVEVATSWWWASGAWRSVSPREQLPPVPRRWPHVCSSKTWSIGSWRWSFRTHAARCISTRW